VTVKRGVRTFVAVDGGMGDNLEVALYGQRFEAAIADNGARRIPWCSRAAARRGSSCGASRWPTCWRDVE